MTLDDPTNTDRALRALQAYRADLDDADAVDEAARDFIGDLCHFLDRRGILPGLVLYRAYEMYEIEHTEDDPGATAPTGHTLACSDCDAKPGRPCTWACPSWERVGEISRSTAA